MEMTAWVILPTRMFANIMSLVVSDLVEVT